MAKIVSIHSFRGGTGKSNSAANLATLLVAQRGLRVGVIDTDIQSPGVHVLFGLAEEEISWALNDYLWGRCNIRQAVHEVTARIGIETEGQVFLIPASIRAGEIARILREGYDVGLLNEGLTHLVETLKLDLLLIDTHPGLNEETLISIAISDSLVIMMRPDQQDYMGTSVTVEVAHKLGVPDMMLVVNKVPPGFDLRMVQEQIEAAYHCPVAAVMPHADEMMTLASSGLFVLRYPDHPVTAALSDVAAALVA